MKARVASVILYDHTHIPYFKAYFDKFRLKREAHVKKIRKETVYALKSLGAEVVLDELVCDVNSARAVASRVVQTDPDLLVFNAPTWPGGDAVLGLINKISNIPLIIWTFLTDRLSLIGFLEVTSDLTAVGRKFKPVIGKTRKAMDQIKCYMAAAAVAKRLRTINVGQIGCAPPAFVDVAASELDLRANLGVELVHLDLHEVFSGIEKTTEKEANDIVSEFKKVGVVKVPDRDLLTPAKIYVALDRIVEKYKLTGYALRCSPEMSFEYCYPCLAVSRLSDKGIVGACEGDLVSAITMVILYELADSPPVVLDVDSGSSEKNILNFWHCGNFATSLAESPEDIVISPPRAGPGGVLSLSMKPGKVTLARLDAKGEKMFVTSGEIVRSYMAGGGGQALEVQLDSDINDVLRRMAEDGVSHHLCLVQGDLKSELESLCDILGIKHIIY